MTKGEVHSRSDQEDGKDGLLDEALKPSLFHNLAEPRLNKKKQTAAAAWATAAKNERG